MLQDHPQPWCWACGRGAAIEHQPVGWYAPWIVERAHIARHPRREDRRAVVLLCPLCHKGGNHAERIVVNGTRYDRPRLELVHLLWLKLHFDRAFYDKQFLKLNSIRELPIARKPPLFYLREYARRRGSVIAEI